MQHSSRMANALGTSIRGRDIIRNRSFEFGINTVRSQACVRQLGKGHRNFRTVGVGPQTIRDNTEGFLERVGVLFHRPLPGFNNLQ